MLQTTCANLKKTAQNLSRINHNFVNWQTVYSFSFLACFMLQGKVIKVLNLWQKNGIYPPEVIQPLLSVPSTLEEGE